MTEHERAKAWREANGFTLPQLAELTGYGRETIWWMEQGSTPPSQKGNPRRGKIKPWVWQRYKMCCAGVEASLKGKKFNW